MAIRGGVHLSRMTTNKSAVCNFAIIRVLPFLNNLKDLDPSYKTDLDFWDCFGRKKKSVLYPRKYGMLNVVFILHDDRCSSSVILCTTPILVSG